jgi:hypothetical protein
MAFMFSDLVVFPVLRIQARYYGWRMAFYILGVFLVALVASALLLHLGFASLDLLPDSSVAQAVADREWFTVDYTLFLDVLFLVLSAVFVLWKTKAEGFDLGSSDSWSERLLLALTVLALLWLVGGMLVPLVAG